jgi:hypothetical protein
MVMEVFDNSMTPDASNALSCFKSATAMSFQASHRYAYRLTTALLLINGESDCLQPLCPFFTST